MIYDDVYEDLIAGMSWRTVEAKAALLRALDAPPDTQPQDAWARACAPTVPSARGEVYEVDPVTVPVIEAA